MVFRDIILKPGYAWSALTTTTTMQGGLQEWREHWILNLKTQGPTFNLNNATETHSNFVKLLENTFLGMPKVRPWPSLTLAMLKVNNQQIQNHAIF